MRNYKKIRQEPYIYGFTMVGFMVFTITSIACLLSLIFGFTGLKCIIVLILVGIDYLACKYLISSPKIQSYLFDNKLPKKYSHYE